MIVRRKGGLTEFIPTPQEKRDGLIRDHVLGLLENLYQRLARLERASKFPATEVEAFTALLARMRAEVVSSVLGYDDIPQLQEVVWAIRRTEARSTASAAFTSISTPRPSTADT